MTGSPSQCRIHAIFKGIQQFKGNKGLYRTGKAAAVNPESARPR